MRSTMKEVKRFDDRGGARLIAVGTDHPSWGEYLSGFGVHRELHALVLAGIPPAAAIQMATLNAAHALRMGDHTMGPATAADDAWWKGNLRLSGYLARPRDIPAAISRSVLRCATRQSH